MTNAQSIGWARSEAGEAGGERARRGRSAASARAATAGSGRPRSGPATRTACAASPRPPPPSGAGGWGRCARAGRRGSALTSARGARSKEAPRGAGRGEISRRGLRHRVSVASGEPGLAQPALQALHLPVVGLVVVAQAVEDAVEEQHLELAVDAVAGRRRLPARRGHGDQDVPQVPPRCRPHPPGKERTSVVLSLARNWRLTRRISRSPAKRTPRLPRRRGERGHQGGEPGPQPARAGFRVVVGIEQDDLARLAGSTRAPRRSEARRSDRVMRRCGSPASPASGRGVEVEARVVDPLVEDVRRARAGTTRRRARRSESVRSVSSSWPSCRQSSTMVRIRPRILAGRRLDQRAARRLDGVGEHQHPHHLALRLGAGIAVLLLGERRRRRGRSAPAPCCRST